MIEIISRGQPFGELTAKAEDYLNAGIDRVWMVDPQAQTVTIFYNNGGFETLSNQATIVDSLLPNLALKVANLFK